MMQKEKSVKNQALRGKTIRAGFFEFVDIFSLGYGFDSF